ncbi:MAG: hypothetical protein PWP65_582 [Clostridia bacterium]|nr:hypothetical protein [Clostridia bacterium]
MSVSGKSTGNKDSGRSQRLCLLLSGGDIQYGGQAVIEGVMMRGPRKVAVAIRRPAGDILVESRFFQSLSARFSFLKMPLLRGVLALLESLFLGVQYLTFSANESLEEGEAKLGTRDVALTVILAAGAAILLFVLMPAGLAWLMRGHLSLFAQNLIEGIARLAIFLGYLLSISRLQDIQRVFQYHGAEHKVINAYEAGEKLTVEAVRPYPVYHPRCGTSFLLLVLILTIIFFSFIRGSGVMERLLARLMLLPLVAGVAYEGIKFFGRHMDSPLVKLMVAPGLALQRLTTREPDDRQIEVALRALEAVMD